jgi:hypothetical protein
MRTATALFSLLGVKAFLSSRSRAGDCLAAEIALKKARSYWFSIGCKQENILTRISPLTGGEHTLSGRNSLSSLAYSFYLTPLTLSIQRNFGSLHCTTTESLVGLVTPGVVSAWSGIESNPDVVGEKWNSQILVNLPVADVPR